MMKKVCIIGIGLIGGSLAKAIKKENDERQFKEDAENYKGFTGWTSSCAYCAIALFVYSIFQ